MDRPRPDPELPSPDLSLVPTDELTAELVRRNFQTVVILESHIEEVTPDGDVPFKVHQGGYLSGDEYPRHRSLVRALWLCTQAQNMMLQKLSECLREDYEEEIDEEEP